MIEPISLSLAIISLIGTFINAIAQYLSQANVSLVSDCCNCRDHEVNDDSKINTILVD